MICDNAKITLRNGLLLAKINQHFYVNKKNFHFFVHTNSSQDGTCNPVLKFMQKSKSENERVDGVTKLRPAMGITFISNEQQP